MVSAFFSDLQIITSNVNLHAAIPYQLLKLVKPVGHILCSEMEPNPASPFSWTPKYPIKRKTEKIVNVPRADILAINPKSDSKANGITISNIQNASRFFDPDVNGVSPIKQRNASIR